MGIGQRRGCPRLRTGRRIPLRGRIPASGAPAPPSAVAHQNGEAVDQVVVGLIGGDSAVLRRWAEDVAFEFVHDETGHYFQSATPR